ncbi:uncharacterized protein HMPREF1541_02223 [Cyphellophora europaea CBS 101466]|uniref:Dihydrofolate synthetase n=1 Tax=Cyphellophora europaea (strain CBS 101466) TaxID=1220924 RepID=W2S380_CYPE1|nr:uncharacterized protein HMPREF1541_02223 [Cyphellophora europaea CBS 101466]ETN43065.1 hypothetical protein HMPREF1541_02223 [Cyphellophora europaea CBS 101466]
MDLQLHRVTRLVRDYHATLPWKAIHIAGTNGKGTTAAYLSAFLHGKGVKVGRFNSPHLKYRHDCIVLNEQTVDKDLFLEVERLVKLRDSEAKLDSTSFELLTATAFEIFSQQKVDVAVVECGMGGRLDATNILLPEEVLCCAITGISLDHQDMLGDTLEKIAAEKAGIIKTGVPVVINSHNQKSVLSVLKARAAACGSPLSESTASDEEPLSRLSRSELAVGASSQENLAIATRVFEKLSQPGRFDVSPLTKADVVSAVAQVKQTWKGRLQWEDLARLATSQSTAERHCLLDGAHNKEGASRLRAYVDQVIAATPRPVVWIVAMSSGKDADEVLSQLIRNGDGVVACEFGDVDGMPWVKPHSAKDLIAIAATKTSGTTLTAPNPVSAVRAAFTHGPEDALVVIGGSLYLVGQVLRDLDKHA